MSFLTTLPASRSLDPVSDVADDTDTIVAEIARAAVRIGDVALFSATG